MKLGNATVNDVQVMAMQRLAERIQTASKGRIKVELYVGGQLGSNPRMVEGLQLGTLEFWTGPAASLTGIDPRYQLMDLPGIFKDMSHAQRTFSDPVFRDAFLSIGNSKGLVGLGTYVYGTTAYATKFEGRSLNDFKGRKLRVLASRVERKNVELMGGTAVPIDVTEMVMALQQGTIDGVKSTPIAFSAFKLAGVVRNITAVEESVLGLVMMVSRPWWDRLPKDLQAIVANEVKAIEPLLYERVISDQAEILRQWVSQGGQVFRLPEAERSKLLDSMREAAADQMRQNKPTAELFEIMLSTAKRAQ